MGSTTVPSGGPPTLTAVRASSIQRSAWQRGHRAQGLARRFRRPTCLFFLFFLFALSVRRCSSA